MQLYTPKIDLDEAYKTASSQVNTKLNRDKFTRDYMSFFNSKTTVDARRLAKKALKISELKQSKGVRIAFLDSVGMSNFLKKYKMSISKAFIAPAVTTRDQIGNCVIIINCIHARDLFRMATVLVHELVHYKQLLSGVLQFTENGAIWNNVEYNYDEYADAFSDTHPDTKDPAGAFILNQFALPWELEAYAVQGKFLNKYIEINESQRTNPTYRALQKAIEVYNE